MSLLGEDKAWIGYSLRILLTAVCGPSHASLEKMHPVTVFVREAPHRSREQPLTGSVLSETTSCGSCAAAEGLKVDEANQPPVSSSSSESSSDEDPKSSGNLNAYNRSAGVSDDWKETTSPTPTREDPAWPLLELGPPSSPAPGSKWVPTSLLSATLFLNSF